MLTRRTSVLQDEHFFFLRVAKHAENRKAFQTVFIKYLCLGVFCLFRVSHTET